MSLVTCYDQPTVPWGRVAGRILQSFQSVPCRRSFTPRCDRPVTALSVSFSSRPQLERLDPIAAQVPELSRGEREAKRYPGSTDGRPLLSLVWRHHLSSPKRSSRVHMDDRHREAMSSQNRRSTAHRIPSTGRGVQLPRQIRMPRPESSRRSLRGPAVHTVQTVDVFPSPLSPPAAALKLSILSLISVLCCTSRFFRASSCAMRSVGEIWRAAFLS